MEHLVIARHSDGTKSTWGWNPAVQPSYTECIRDVRQAIVEETGKEPVVVLVRIK